MPPRSSRRSSVSKHVTRPSLPQWPARLEAKVESEEGAIRADEYYRACLPPPHVPIELLILSESHAFTDGRALARELKPEHRHPGAPDGHLHVVHALSYGEPWMLEEEAKRGGGSGGGSGGDCDLVDMTAEEDGGGVAADDNEAYEAATKSMHRTLSSGTPPFWKVREYSMAAAAAAAAATAGHGLGPTHNLSSHNRCWLRSRGASIRRAGPRAVG